MFRRYKIPFSLDDPRATIAHREIILNKPFLKKLYTEWYKEFFKNLSVKKGNKYLEIGSGGGFLKNIFPEIITSDILPLPNVDMVVNAEEIPFSNGELSGIFMLNVFHHIPRPWMFLKEAERSLKHGGKVVMIEPANTPFARFIYKKFHHEPFDEKGPREITPGNPLSNSNQALPYIYFQRDIEVFEKEFRGLKIVDIKYHSPFIYIFSGGVSRSALLPYFMYPAVRLFEKILSPFNRYLGLFCTVELERV